MTDHLDRARDILAGLGLSASARSAPCPGCGALVPIIRGGPAHRSIGASAGCWALYTALLSREFAAFDARVHQLSVDSYAAQHPGTPSPQAIQSVCTHLVALCLSLEHGFGVEALRPVMGDLGKGRWFEPVWLEPPAPPWPLTVVDLIGAEAPGEYAARVREWASATWKAWSAHHARVRAWSRRVILDRR